MQELIGKHIAKIELNDDDTAIVFTTKDGERIAYATSADCCSETWFSSINGLSNLSLSPIVKVEPRPEIDELPSQRQIEDILYGYFLSGAHWTAEIEFRNASNGYYGGSCELTDAEAVTNLREITADF